MNKTVVWIVVLVLVVGGFVMFSGKSGPTETGPIKIGFIAPLTGDGASFGETEKGATQMVFDSINASGGIEGRIVEVIYEDGKCNGKDSVSAMSKLINIDKVSVVLGGACSSETLAVAPLAEENKVILFSSFSSNPAITSAGDYVFRNAPSDSDVGKLDADTIIKGGFKKVAIVSEKNDYAQGVKEVLLKEFSKAGLSVVYDDSFAGGITNFRDYVVKVKQSKADIVYINPGSSGKTGALFIKQLRESGSKITIHGNFSIGTPEAFQIGANFLDGVVISDSVATAQNLKDLLQEYQTKTGNKAANDFEFGASYDRANIIANAIKSVGYNADKIKKYLYTMSEYNGVIGRYKFDSNGDIVGGPFFGEYIIKGQNKQLISQ
ncbi:MAG: ABC transporter substrate-binding protein [Candidatus Daviesbacteria bacterium]|nr:ABC transporter substrate-binding protein [Candidatus Daviesbacteria bacterium]